MVTNKSLKLIILPILALIAVMSSVFAADVYIPYKTVFSTNEIPSSIYVSGYACKNTDCSSVDYSKPIELYNGNAAVKCWEDFATGKTNANQFLSCMSNSKLNSNYQSIDSEGDFIVAKFNTDVSFGHLTYFSASDDSYMVKYDRTNDYACEYDICFENSYRNLEFVKGLGAIAEVGELNIKNTDNPNKPVQVEVPVEISETVCSAYKFANPNWWRASIPNGYSDYSAETDIRLKISNDETGTQYFNKKVTTSFLAGQCSSLQTFEWTPSSSLENTRVEFEVSTDVVDNQVLTSEKDFVWAYETIYPKELDTACYVRIEDFMLSNEPGFDLNTEVAEILVGEDLFANFKAGAFRDEAVTPMDFTAKVYLDDNLIYSGVYSTPSSSQYGEFSQELTDLISGFGAGTHQVKLVTEPSGEGCDISHDTTQILNLKISEVPKYNVKFRVLGDGYELVGADVVFDSISLNTGDNGEVGFSGVLAGEYDYTVSYTGYNSKSGSIVVGSDVFVTITLDKENSLPVVSIPDFSDYYKNDITFDLRSYVVDYNDKFEDLDVVVEKVSGSSAFGYSNGNLVISSLNNIGTSTYRVTVTDLAGARAVDTFNVEFFDNSAPEIIEFSADDYDGYKVFTTNFNVVVDDLENDIQSCRIDFGDGTFVEKSNCDELNRISHSFEEIGNYQVKLTVKDELNEEVTKSLVIYVYEETFRPYVVDFDLVSSNGNKVPTNLEFTFKAEHENPNTQITCQLFVNSQSYNVDCDGTTTLNGFDVEGESNFMFVVTDEFGYDDKAMIRRNFEKEIIVDYNPFITSFDVVSSNGNYVPTNLTFNYVVGHENNEQIVCELKVNTQSYSIPCSSGQFSVDNFVTEGVSTFELIVTDLDGDLVNSVITRTFEKEVVVIDYKPFITNFEVFSSNGNYVPTNLKFSNIVGHENNEDIVCSIFVNGFEYDVGCNDEFDLNNYNIVGTGVFTLVVSEVNGNDSVSRTISMSFDEEVVIDYKPFITNFEVFSSNGNYVPTNLKFSNIVGHENNEDIVCSIFVNGFEYNVGCNDDFDLNNYNVEGLGLFRLVVTDLDGDSVSRVITMNFEREVIIDYKPYITTFQVYSDNGNFVPTNLTFLNVVGHENDEDIVCSIFVNGFEYNVDCNSSFDLNNYDVEGLGLFRLVVSEVNGDDTVSRVITMNFEREVIVDNSMPFITSFDVVSSEGGFVSTNLTFDYVVGHENPNTNYTCELDINSAVYLVDCNSSFNFNNYDEVGTGVFELVVRDEFGKVVRSEISREFEQKLIIVGLDELGLELIVDEKLTLGEFDFAIKVDEAMARRVVEVKPQLICKNGIANLANDGKLNAGLFSSNKVGHSSVFEFSVDTKDFNLYVRDGYDCEFGVYLYDNYGSEFVYLSKDVEFYTPIVEKTFTSIRGNGLDIMNYMHTALNSNVEVGYNDVEFKVSNHKDERKMIEISVMSAHLGISFNDNIVLDAGEIQTVEVPLFIKSGTKGGLYPVRVSVVDGAEKYTRYSYIKVE